MADLAPRFLVARIGWSISWYQQGTSFYPATRDTAEPEDRRFVPVVAFAERAAAELRMRELELEAARLFNPFWKAGSLEYLTSLPPADFIARLAELVGKLPAKTVTVDNRPWREWWDEHAPSWPDETLAKVWELFDRIQFYAVLEVEAE